jgi:hypothetical protein
MGWLVGKRECCARPGMTLIGELLQARPARGHDTHLRHRKYAVQDDQQEQNQNVHKSSCVTEAQRSRPARAQARNRRGRPRTA